MFISLYIPIFQPVCHHPKSKTIKETLDSPAKRRTNMAPTIHNFSYSKRFSESFNSSTSKKESSSSNIIAFHSTAQWNAYYKTTKETNKLMVLDFTATWCAPCKLMDPVILEFAENYTDVEFIKIDVEELTEVSQALQVHQLPTFVLVQKGKVADRVVGMKKEELKRSIEKHRINK